MKFDFQKLDVYKKAKAFHEVTRSIVSKNCVTGYYNDQICRASFSVVLNIAEGSGRFSKAEKKLKHNSYALISIIFGQTKTKTQFDNLSDQDIH